MPHMKNRKRSKSAATRSGGPAGAEDAGRQTSAAACRGAHQSSFAADDRAAAVTRAFLLLAVMLVFGQTLGHGFVNFDDDYYVCQNHHVIGGLTTEGIGWAFTATHSSNWHPLTWLSHMLDCQLYGLKPWGHHLSSVVLHAATAIVLLLALWRMTGDLGPWFVAALFAIHPLRVESVAWVAERETS